MNVHRNPLVRQALPGVIVALVLWLITFIRWDAPAFATAEMDALWQSAGIGHLTADPWGTLGVLHIQPPGMNALFAVDLWLTPTSHAFILGVNLVALLGTVVLIVDTLRRWGAARVVTTTGGIAYALLPSTVIYSQWVYSVSAIAFLSMAALWGLAVMKQRPNLGAIVSASSLVLAALIRPSYAVPFVLVWLIGLGVLLWRRHGMPRWSGALGLVAMGALLLGMQAHYLASFGLPTMSSWTGENLAKALQTSGSLRVSEAARAEIAESPCRSEMLAAYEVGDLNRWDPDAFRGLPACSTLPMLESRGVAAWDSPLKAGTSEGNFVYSDRLVASREWTQMMTTIVRHDPMQLVRMAITTDYGPSGSGLGLYLSPAEDYPFVKDIRDAHPLAVPLGLWSLLFPALAWSLVIFGAALALFGRNRGLRGSVVFWAGVFLVTYHLAVNVLFEYSENMRYRAEIDAVLLTTAAIVVGSLYRRSSR